MSIGQDIRTRRKHRGKTPWQLVQTIGRLEREADEATCQLVALATENDELRAERNQLAARLDETVLANQATIDELTAERGELLAEVTALRAAAANAARVDVPPMVRDTSAIEDQATAPIDVRPLWQAPFATTNPGRIA